MKSPFVSIWVKGGFWVLAGTLLQSGVIAKEKDPRYVSLKEAHIGTVEIDLRILNQFEEQPQATIDFYLECRKAMEEGKSEQEIAAIFEKYGRRSYGGPLLGQITESSVVVRMQLPTSRDLEVQVSLDKGEKSSGTFQSDAGKIHCITCDGLSPNTLYKYQVFDKESGDEIGAGAFRTMPPVDFKKPFKIGIGADFHKIGLHRPELFSLVHERGCRAMPLLGDLATDGRQGNIVMRNVDYLLRDISPTWQKFASHIPIYATWDDHDYHGNDSFGATTNSGKSINVAALRENWLTHWNNPAPAQKSEGIYFQTRLGPVHLIMLDTRSSRIQEDRGKLYSFLGKAQTQWLTDQITASDAPFILISGGTMWTDFISDGKDSWGTWDKEGREELFQLLDTKTDAKIALFSGDRHGTHAFRIARPNGTVLYEFGVGSMGGVPGGGKAKDDSAQLFAYPGHSTWAFGELEFSPNGELVFRLINEKGEELEEIKVENRK